MINKFQQGGKQLDAIMQFVQGLAQVLLVDPQQIALIALQNPKALKSAVLVYQQTQDINQAAQAFAQSVQKAKRGAKLNYLKSLKHQCAEDEELYYYKKGGSVGCGCKKKEDGGEVKKAGLGCSVVDKFKKMQHGGLSSNINKNDTIHVNGKVKSLTGKPVKDKKKTYKPLTNDEYKKLKNNDKNRVDEKDIARGRLVAKKGMKVEKDCGGAVAKFKKAFRKGGSLNGVPFIRKTLFKAYGLD